MKRLYCLIVLSLLCGRLAAQRLHSFHFHDASLAAVLDTLAAVQDEYSITFIHNDLEHLHVSARIKNLTIKEAVEKVCKGQPVKVKTRRQQVFVQYKPRKNFPNKTIQITGLVLDSFTLKPVGQIDVTILDATHTVISKTRTATDLNLFQRRGYGMGMNTDDVIWNTHLTKNWLKGRLQTRLTAYDILNQMHHNSYIITAEGYQSRWEKGMSRYALLSLFYRIDIKPKKARH